jgi:hypothetical protein
MESLERKIRNKGFIWRENIKKFTDEITENDFNKDVLSSLQKDTDYFLNTKRDNLAQISSEKLIDIKENMKKYKDYVDELYYGNHSDLRNIKIRENDLNSQIDNLKKGIKPYDPKLLELRDEIKKNLSAEHGKEIEVNIFCELLEIKDKKWQDAVEGYLHTQKFYLIVAPQYFEEALKIYDDLKFKRKFYDIGLVDIDKLKKLNPEKRKGSLAEEVLAQDSYAQTFLNFLLGRVMKCESVEDLRKYRTAITSTCMLYQNFTARQLNPRRWKIKNSLEKQLQQKEREMKELLIQKNELVHIDKILINLKEIEVLTVDEIENIQKSLEEIRPYHDLKKQLQEIIAELGSLDLTYLQQIDGRIEAVEKKRDNIEKEILEFKTYLKELEIKTKSINEEKIPKAQGKLDNTWQMISEKYDSQWISEIGEKRFLKELQQRKTPQDILEAFKTQIVRTKNQQEKKWHELIRVRTDYNRDYKMAYDVFSKNNEHFSTELNELKDTQLAKYEDKIKDAKEKAQNQFQEDFISKLKQNIDTVKEQINELNDALKAVVFGRDSYHFEVRPDSYYKKYYDMITDNMLLEGFNLFSREFQSKHSDAIDELFKQIVDVGEGNLTADQRAELEKNIEKFTDYRTYLNFDLIVTDDMGRKSRLSKMITKKSGGETQTPFYISVLASFVRVYRINRNNGESGNTLRLIIFDEAFNKMDHQRIQESIKLLKNMGLQPIVSAPTEKIGDIAPLVNRNLCVTRVKGTTVVKAFDPKEVLED